MKPEAKTEIILWDWFAKREETISSIYFNRKNEAGWNVFNTKGLNEKPDLIIGFNKGYGREYIAIEVKNSKKSRDIYDACKILDYYENYITEKTKYFINGKQIEIKHFAIATDKSPEGFLFKDEKEITETINNLENGDQHRKHLASLGLMPEKEYKKTSEFLRTLWSNWRRKRKKLNFTKAPSIGILTSDIEDKNTPQLFTMVYVDWLDKKPKWGQRLFKF